MTNFSIDDVRETMTADVSALLLAIEEAAPSVARLPLPHDHDDRLRVVEEAGHAIYGTAALVGAESLAGTARLLEDLAAKGREGLAVAQRHAERARRIAELAREAATEMRAMLGLELEHRGDDAQWIALEWQERARAVLNEPTEAPRTYTTPAVPHPSSRVAPPVIEEEAIEDAFSFAEEEGAPATAEAPAAIAEELRAIFEEEARECVIALQGHLDALYANPADLVAARHLERLFHTLKGAAATVGLASVSAFAHALQDRMQDVVERGASLDAAMLDAIVADVTLLLGAAGLVDVRVASRAAATSKATVRVEEAAVRADFRSEMRGIFEDGSALLERFELAGVRASLARLFHRVKGSAWVAKEHAIAEEAEKLEAACASDGASRAEIASGLAKMAALAGVPGAEGFASQSASTGALDDGARATFVAEARQICDEVEGIAEHPQTDAVDAIARLFHRLRGSALVLREEAIAAAASRAQRACAEGGSESIATAREAVSLVRAAIGDVRADERSNADRIERCDVATGDPELWEAFTQECAELLDALDRGALALEESSRPTEPLASILRTVHTLKGVVNTMGLAPTGAALHRVEDLLESLGDGAPMPPLRPLASFLLQLAVEVRRSLKQAKRGFVEVAIGKLEGQIAWLLAGGHHAPSQGRSAEPSSAVDDRKSATGGSMDRAFVRVATDRLDALMNFAGELVVSRSRLLARVEALRLVQGDLGRGVRRILSAVDKFCEEHEFAWLDGSARRAALPMAAGAESMSAPVEGAAAWSGFGELELDRYEDVHILSRSLTELTSDLSEIHGELTSGLSALSDDSDAFGGIVGGIQSEITRARMVPLEALFARLRLPIRDAAARESREVRVVTRGDDVPLDKTIADALFQPMLHLVRNAVAHGLESPSRREALGKPRTGAIELIARQELGQVVLEVLDDGAGLDLARLRARGVAMGLVPAEVSEDDPRIPELVFAAGLSTAVGARDVAGRGIGCDVVRRAVERMNGSIRVESTAGVGTRFVLTLPITLAITKALLVEQGGRPFAVPLYFTERILDAVDAEVIDSAGVRRVRLDGGFVPVQSLGARLFGEESERRDGPILVVRVGGERALFQVDGVLGQEEIVVKDLGAILTGHPLFAGVSVRGRGEMVLILDVPALLEARSARAPARVEIAPAAAVVEKEAPASEPRLKAIAEPSSEARALRVMFVDDSLSVRKVAEKALLALGVEVTTAIDGVDALAKMRESSFDLVFTDLEMPRMHGFELIRELRFLKAYQDIPIVVVTSRSGQKHQEQARALGASEYLTKPFTAQSLAAAVETWGKARKGVSS